MGFGYFRNKALERAKYRYVAVLDADNELIPENFHQLVKAIRERDATIVFGNLITVSRKATGVRGNQYFDHELYEKNYIDACALVDYDQGYRLILPREESPFWVESEIGILSGKNADRIEQYLAHTALLLNGNFQFLDIVRRLAESEMKSSRLMEEFYDRGNKKKGETGILKKVKGFIKKRL